MSLKNTLTVRPELVEGRVHGLTSSPRTEFTA